MPPIEKVLARLPNPKPYGDSYKARCPAHDDGNPSLSIGIGDDGRVLLKCFAGCPAEAIVNALGLTMADLFPDRHDLAPAIRKSRRQKVFQRPEDAAIAYGFGEPNRQWIYLDQSGVEVGKVLRWDPDNPEGEKIIRPISLREEGWKLTAPPTPRPLFNLPQINATPDTVVYVVEGEKCVDAMGALGLLATTSMGGAKAPHQSDWSDLEGRSVVILPDNDESGRGYADAVCGMLLRLGATVRIVALAELGEKEDVADLFDRCASDADRQRLQEQIEEQTNTAKEITVSSTAATSSLSFQPFPTDALPETVAVIVKQAAKSIGCDEAAVALHSLSALGVACGNWRIAIKEDWLAPPAIWTVIARSSGQQKSPALDISLDHFRDLQELHDQQHEKQPKTKDAPGRPVTLWVDNATTEGLDDAFKGNPRGILYGCDELSGWLGTFGVYKNGRSTADEGWYCQRYGGRASNSVRKSKDHRGGCAKGVLGITGCTTVATLRSMLTQSVRDSGLMARLLICIPPERPRRWTDDTVSPEAKKSYYDLLDRLLEDTEAKTVRLGSEAKELFKDYFTRHNTEAESLLKEELRPVYGKLEEMPARLAIILHAVAGEVGEVTMANMAKAIKITEWAKNETQRVYAILSETAEQQSVRSENERLLAWLEGRDWVTVRDIERGPQCFRGTGKAVACLNELIAMGMVEQKGAPAGENGGHPSTVYRMKRDDDPVPVAPMLATQPPQTREKEGSVAVAGGEVWTKL
jgi:hypothetical protein